MEKVKNFKVLIGWFVCGLFHSSSVYLDFVLC
jgi:hypothetical protein